MLTPKPLAAAIAALALACAGTAAAEDRHRNEIDILSYSFGTTTQVPKGQNALQSEPRASEQKYMEIKLKEVLISGVIQNGNPAAPPPPAQQQFLAAPPANPASTPMPKLHGLNVNPAIAINTPLRTLPNRSPVAAGSTHTLMMGPVAGPARR
jgi:hypothetical protein